jgi:hypothetical protein
VRPLDEAVLTTWNTSPDTAVLRSTSLPRSAKDRAARQSAHEKKLCALCMLSAHILFGRPPHTQQDNQINCLIILLRKRCRGDLVRVVSLIRTFLRKPDKPPGSTKRRDRQRTGEPSHKKGLLALIALLAHIYLANHLQGWPCAPPGRSASRDAAGFLTIAPTLIERGAHPSGSLSLVCAFPAIAAQLDAAVTQSTRRS